MNDLMTEQPTAPIVWNAGVVLTTLTDGVNAGLPAPFAMNARSLGVSMYFHTAGDLAQWVKWLGAPVPRQGVTQSDQLVTFVDRGGVTIELAGFADTEVAA